MRGQERLALMAEPAAQPISPGESDLSLSQRAANGDMVAFEQIMRRNNRMLFRVARSILRHEAEAEDCLQTAYLHAHRSLGGFAGRSKLSTWLARIVVNEALARKRQAVRRGVVVPLDTAARFVGTARQPDGEALRAETPGPETEAIRRELGALIERRVDGLPEAFRTVFVLRAVEELTVEETAELLGIPEATVRSRYFRARGILRQSLAHELDRALLAAFTFGGARCDRVVVGVLDRIGRGPP
jgi:RNA polymerase sigma-70 factor (ECF subfamily)